MKYSTLKMSNLDFYSHYDRNVLALAFLKGITL